MSYFSYMRTGFDPQDCWGKKKKENMEYYYIYSVKV